MKYRNQRAALVANAKKAKKRVKNPLKLDPSRTATIRRAYVTDLRRRFARLRLKVQKKILEEFPTTNCNPDQMRSAEGRCGPGIGVGIKREEMPQIKTDDMDAFVKFVEGRGVSIRLGRVKASELRPTQKEFRQERVDAIPDDTLQSTRLLTSKDGFILDGTHRWIKHWQKDREAMVPVRQINLRLAEALRLMRAFPSTVYAQNVFCATGEGGGVDPSCSPAKTEIGVFKRGRSGIVTNASWSAQRDPQKLESFQDWLEEQFEDDILGADPDMLYRKYIEQGYRKGAARAFDDTHKPDALKAIREAKPEFYRGSRDQFLKSTFAQPVSRERVEMLASRNFNDLDGVTDFMSTKMTRTLADGLTTGASPYDIAKSLDDDIGIGQDRAETVARTEIIRAHAEGQLDGLEAMGVESVGVAVEWLVTDDEKLCDLCAPLADVVLKIDEARGLLPRHPNCRCAWIPANVGEDDEEQKDTKEDIEAAFGKSGFEQKVDKDRPESIFNTLLDYEILYNVFCATGPGGGVDATCGAHDKDENVHTTAGHELVTKIAESAKKFTAKQIERIGLLNPRGVEKGVIRVAHGLDKARMDELTKLFPGTKVTRVWFNEKKEAQVRAANDKLRGAQAGHQRLG